MRVNCNDFQITKKTHDSIEIYNMNFDTTSFLGTLKSGLELSHTIKELYETTFLTTCQKKLKTVHPEIFFKISGVATVNCNNSKLRALQQQ